MYVKGFEGKISEINKCVGPNEVVWVVFFAKKYLPGQSSLSARCQNFKKLRSYKIKLNLFLEKKTNIENDIFQE